MVDVTHREDHPPLCFVHVHRQEILGVTLGGAWREKGQDRCVGLSQAPCGGKAKIENTLFEEIRRGIISSEDNPPKKAGGNDARAYNMSCLWP